MSPFEVTREALAGSLEQILPLLDLMTDDGFRCGDIELGISGIGAHVRHVGDAVECFLLGVHEGGERVDYDARRRDERQERERSVAAKRVADLAARVRALESDSRQLRLRVSHDTPKGAPQPIAISTLEREMMFLASHCVHHYALVAIVLRRREIAVPPEFGVAVSTLRSRNEEPACVR